MNRDQLQALAIAAVTGRFSSALGTDKARAPRDGEKVAEYADRIRRSHVRFAEKSISDLAIEVSAEVESADLIIFRARLALAQ